MLIRSVVSATFFASLIFLGCGKKDKNPPTEPYTPQKCIDAMAEESDPLILKKDAIWRKLNKEKIGLRASLDSNGGGFELSQPTQTHECKLHELEFVCDPNETPRKKIEIKKIHEVCIPLSGTTYKEAIEFRDSQTQQTVAGILQSLSEFGNCEFKPTESNEPTIFHGTIREFLDSTTKRTNYAFLDLDIPPSVAGSIQNKKHNSWCQGSPDLAYCLSMQSASFQVGKVVWGRNSTSIPYTCARLKESFEVIGDKVSYFSKDLSELWQIFGCETLN